MHADSGHASASAAPAGGADFRAERWHVARLVHLRSAGRAGEHAGLDRLLSAEAGLPALAQPGALHEFEAPGAPGQRAFALRMRPSEALIVVAGAAPAPVPPQAAALLARCSAAAGASPLLHAVEASDGHALLRLHGAQVRDVLLRLADALSLPAAPGSATRLRLAELPATLSWCRDGSHFVLVDALYTAFLAEWFAYAAGGIDPPTSEGLRA